MIYLEFGQFRYELFYYIILQYHPKNLQHFNHSIPNLQLTFWPNLQSTKKVHPPPEYYIEYVYLGVAIFHI